MDNTSSQTVGSAASLAKCAHEGCTCTVEQGAQFCSDYCLEHAGTGHDTADDECQCGHAECEHVMAATPSVLAPATSR